MNSPQPRVNHPITESGAIQMTDAVTQLQEKLKRSSEFTDEIRILMLDTGYSANGADNGADQTPLPFGDGR